MLLLVERNGKDAELILDSLRRLMPTDCIRLAQNGTGAMEIIDHWNGELIWVPR